MAFTAKRFQGALGPSTLQSEQSRDPRRGLIIHKHPDDNNFGFQSILVTNSRWRHCIPNLFSSTFLFLFISPSLSPFPVFTASGTHDTEPFILPCGLPASSPRDEESSKESKPRQPSGSITGLRLRCAHSISSTGATGNMWEQRPLVSSCSHVVCIHRGTVHGFLSSIKSKLSI